MQRIALIIFVASELCYYLLIAQTGIVEYFSSNLYLIAPLPIGGIIGSLLGYYIKVSNSRKILFFLSIQLIISFFYPNFSIYLLFGLGLCVGAIAPLMINELKKTTQIDLAIALALSYTIGTYLFNYEVASRAPIAIILSIITLISSIFLTQTVYTSKHYENFSLLTMLLWVFIDSALFETLSRDSAISIWRGGYSLEIAIFHILGVVAALRIDITKRQKELFTMMFFAFSYLFYFSREPHILAAIYPFVISYYNVNILKTILNKDLKHICIYMIFIGWLSSGAGLFVALNDMILLVPTIFFIVFFVIISKEKNQNKEFNYV